MVYSLNDGKLSVYKKVKTEADGRKPKPKFEFFSEFYFEYIGIYADEYYKSKQSNVEIKTRVRILRCQKIASNDIVVIDGEQFDVGRVCHASNKSGIPVTDMTLERVVAVYDIK